MSVKFKVINLRREIRRLEKFSEKVQRRIIRSALTSGNSVLVRAIKKQIPARGQSGRPLKEIKSAVRAKIFKSKDGTVQAKIGFGVGLKRGAYPPHTHLVVAGTKARKQNTTGRPTGQITKPGWLNKGVTSSRSAVKNKMKQRFKQLTKKEWDKSKK